VLQGCCCKAAAAWVQLREHSAAKLQQEYAARLLVLVLVLVLVPVPVPASSNKDGRSPHSRAHAMSQVLLCASYSTPFSLHLGQWPLSTSLRDSPDTRAAALGLVAGGLSRVLQ
jgi:hypothetical protein